ncbi:insulin-like receptor [Fopius arisanus]|uniref:Tyrosine-protein kinase receptor n=1 Tax=Fopius arisanus TaxID=64838 RepID=A0A0C9QS61_9HYME|nr:PREDICTED: insulin-like receptor [Fopius arisanus]XP_011300658.1 PREDICTED: insulin-like receptor [Fopius arisanus]
MESSRVIFGCPDCMSNLVSTASTTRCSLCERLQGNPTESDDMRYKLLDNAGSNNGFNANGERIQCHGFIRTMRTRYGDSRGASSVVRWAGSSGNSFSLLSVTVFVLLIAFVNVTVAELNLSTVGKATNSSNNGVCQSIDIRNHVDQFSRLRGCRVVEGFVQILLIDHANETAYINQTFPELIEITGYLVLYRVNGLKSIGRLFPNLAVIRGNSLFIDYALVAFEMMHLQEIGLHSLTDILRGGVRFEKNPALCYADTIDWNMILKDKDKEIKDIAHIGGNKPRNGCPVCDRHCPTRQTNKDETLCWNRQHCQKVCDKACGDRTCAAHDPSSCCHTSCLGGCTGGSSTQNCTVCKDVLVAGSCVKDCPSGTYKFMKRRCIQENECRKMKKPREAYNNIKYYPYKPFNNTCLIDCPPGFMEEERDGKQTCKKCDGHCLKECSGANVDSIVSAQKLSGCTHIKGSLEIQIRGGKNIVQELEESLNMIEEIDGYLKIVRSFPLISLNFLKNLRSIKGQYLDNGKYTLAVLDNQNLQELWNWETHPGIKIGSIDGDAKVFFHFNPKLCLQKIEALREKADLKEFTDLEVAPNSNGDKVACNVTKLKTFVAKRTAEAALINWERFQHHDPRSLLGYVVYFIEAPYQNVTMYDGRDACGGDRWRVDDVAATDSSEPYLTHILTQLKSYTQYAYYVKTYTIATERSGAQSDLMYFTTLPSPPEPPRVLLTWSNSSSELIIHWTEPISFNGNLTHYRIVGKWEPDDSAFLAQRNYCEEPMHLPEKRTEAERVEEERKRAETERELTKLPEQAACDCADRESDQLMREKEVSSSIAFEDALHNRVYIKRINNRRKRNSSGYSSASIEDDPIYDDLFGVKGDFSPGLLSTSLRKRAVKSPGDQPAPDKFLNGGIIAFERLVPSDKKSFVMRNLRNFAAYNIEIQACRQQVANESDLCSTKTMRTYRTLQLEGADDIPVDSFRYTIIGGNSSQQMVKLEWDEPNQPNGIIVTYHIEYKRIDIQNFQVTPICITQRDFAAAGRSYILKNLSTGNYSVKVRATSLAGAGSDSETKYFYIVEYNTKGTFWVIFWSVLAFVVFLALSGVWFFKRKLMRNMPSMRLIATVNPEYVSTVYVPDEWEMPRKKIRLLKELGNGSFGMVYEGLAKDVVKGKPEVKCAVKTVNENATDRERIEFLNEASVMKAFNTHHVVRLLGVVSRGQPTLVVMELMVNGDLKTYLRSHRPDQCDSMTHLAKQPPTLKRILRMATEIADGMAYLSAKKFVHRDLAARNCMVAEDLTVKIGDFGMTRDIYETDYYRKGTKGLLPVRWMAPESLKDGVFTSSSDVWSYGIVLWEMVTLASQPYQGLSNDQVLRYVIDGGVMERPENCPDSLYILMRRTWNQKVNRRPTFIDIATMLLQEVDLEGFSEVSFYHSPEGIEARNQNSQNSPGIDKDFELSLQELREDEIEEDEDSPLRRDFDDFASIEPACLRNSANSRYSSEPCGENSKLVTNFHDFNSSKIPLKAGFDDFDGVSGGSLSSSKDTLDFPFVEDSLKSVKNSPSILKNSYTPRESVSPASGKNSLSPQNRIGSLTSNRGRNIQHAKTPDCQNRTPEEVSSIENKDTVSLKIIFPTPIEVEADIITNDDKDKSPVDYTKKPENLNNGYISGTTT